VEEVIERMDEYYLSKEDWDTVVEMGIDDRKDSVVLKKISSATKTAFTKKYELFSLILCQADDVHVRYNSTEHPIAFHKAQDLGKVPKKLAAGPAPDVEEAFDVCGDEFLYSFQMAYLSLTSRWMML